MNKQNFQIGNIVQYKGEIIEISAELLGKFLLDQLDEPFVPIEITKEWLLRFGFRAIYNNWYAILNRTFWIKKNEEENLKKWLFGCTKLEYFTHEVKCVHEIQNAVSHLNETSIGININTEIEILGAKLFNLSPLEQLIEILKKQIELYKFEGSSYDTEYTARQYKLLSNLDDLKEKELK